MEEGRLRDNYQQPLGARGRKCSQVLNTGAWWEDGRTWAKVQTREVWMDIRRKIFPREGSQAMDPGHRKVLPSLSLEVFKPQLGKGPSNLFWSHCYFGQEISWGPLPAELAYHSWVTAWLKRQLKVEWHDDYSTPCLHFQSTAYDYAA